MWMGEQIIVKECAIENYWPVTTDVNRPTVGLMNYELGHNIISQIW